MGKKGASPCYKASRDGFSSEIFWKKCLGQKETIVLVQTNFNSVIGGYMPEQWENTKVMKHSEGYLGYKVITSGSPFLFYWVNDEIEIIKHRDDQIPIMVSKKDWPMAFKWGLLINADQNKRS